MRKFILRSKTNFVTLSVFAFLFLNQSVVYSQNGCLVDQTKQDFQSGTPDANTYISSFADGEVILNPTLASEFSGSTVPAAFTEGTWNRRRSYYFQWWHYVSQWYAHCKQQFIFTWYCNRIFSVF